MEARKGMSQVLALIVAASVLMMTALTVIFLTQGSLGGLGQTTTRQACVSTLDTRCQASGATDVSLPSSCVTNSGNVIQGFPSSRFTGATPGGEASEVDTVTCPQ